MKFPQIYRKITATLRPDVTSGLRSCTALFKIMLLLILTALLLTQLYPTNSLPQAQAAVLLSPANVSLHLLLSQEYLAAGNTEAVERELTLAHNLILITRHTTQNLPAGRQDPFSSVLGTTLSPLKIWERIKSEPKQIQEEIKYWEKIIEERPDYRDAYLQLAVLNYRIYQVEKAKEYLKKAKELDPNYEKTKELEFLISND